MPLLEGKKNVGHNIKVEEEHGKPKKQAVAIALNKAGESKDTVQPVSLAEAKHNAGVTVSQDKRTKDSSIVQPVPLATKSTAIRAVPMPAGERNQPSLAPVPVGDDFDEYREDRYDLQGSIGKLIVSLAKKGRTVSDIAKQVGLDKQLVANTIKASKAGKTRDAALLPKDAQLAPGTKVHNSRGQFGKVKEHRSNGVVIVETDRGPELWDLNKTFRAADGKAKDFQTPAARENEAIKLLAREFSVSTQEAANALRNTPASKPLDKRMDMAAEFLELHAEDAVLPVPVNDVERETKLAPVPVKPRPYVPFHMSPEDIKKAYEPVGSAGKGRLGIKDDQVDVVVELTQRIKQAVKKAKAEGTVGMSEANLKQLVNTRGLSFANPNHFERSFRAALTRAGVGGFAKDRARAADSLVDPTVHLNNAMKYEVGGDRARALDSYRAAASGFRRNGNRDSLERALDGVAECQRRMVGETGAFYGHPKAGRVQACDSTDKALRVALERTRAGEDVSVEGQRVVPRSKREAYA